MRSRRTRGRIAMVSAVVLALVGIPYATASATAATPPLPSSPLLPTTGAGVDISYPQCDSGLHEEMPAGVPFAVIGINGGVSSSDNPCFQSEYNSALLLAGATEQPHASVYVNTGNPALKAAWWPKADIAQDGTPVINPDGSCVGKAGAACAYVYGYSMARADYRRAKDKLTTIPTLWWLDVETTNTWQADTGANAASLAGMVDYFTTRRLSVGIYSTSYQWKKIAGVTPASSSLAGLRSWLAGGSGPGAPIDCEKSPLTPNGWVSMIQYVTHFDNDFSCHLFSSASAVASPSAISAVGGVLVASHGRWASGEVDYGYQWERDGKAIAGATDSSYLTTQDDVGSSITVAITGMKSGYSTRTMTSTPVLVLAMTA